MSQPTPAPTPAPTTNLMRMALERRGPLLIVNGDRRKVGRYVTPWTPAEGGKQETRFYAEGGVVVVVDERDVDPVTGRPRKRFLSIATAEERLRMIREQARHVRSRIGRYPREGDALDRFGDQVARVIAEAKRQRDRRGEVFAAAVSVPKLVVPGAGA